MEGGFLNGHANDIRNNIYMHLIKYIFVYLIFSILLTYLCMLFKSVKYTEHSYHFYYNMYNVASKSSIFGCKMCKDCLYHFHSININNHLICWHCTVSFHSNIPKKMFCNESVIGRQSASTNVSFS